MRRTLSVLQVAVAMGLASYTLAIFWQTQYAMESSPGFDPSSLLVLEFPDAITMRKSENAAHFMAALSQQPAVAGVAMSGETLGLNRGEGGRIEIRREGGQDASIELKSVSAGFFEQYGIRPVAGRLFDPKLDKEEDAVPTVINALAARQLGFASPELAVGQTLLFKRPSAEPIAKRIVGIVPIRYRSLRESPQPVAFELWMRDGTLTVRAADPSRMQSRPCVGYGLGISPMTGSSSLW